MHTQSKKLATLGLLAGCVLMPIALSGCRSTMPGMNLFARRGEPSPETLAGSGPTVTYPVPPSASATPQAIASVAGGTAVPVSSGQPESEAAKIAGFQSPAAGASSTATAPNLAAAQANGFPNSTLPAGYPFGSKAFTPKAPASLAADSTAPGSTNTRPAISGLTASSSPTATTTKASGAELPTSYSISAKTTAPSSTTSSSTASSEPNAGFTLPPGIGPALAEASTAPKDFSQETATAPASQNASSGFSMPGSDPPAFSTATATDPVQAPSTTLSAPLPSRSASGYSPGSTAGSTAYPATSGSSDSGSVYR